MTRADNKERLWHRRFGHLNEQSMQKLVREGLVDQLDYNTSREIGICEACIGGKQCKSSFEQSRTATSMPLKLVHSDVCGKVGEKSLGGAEYFLTTTRPTTPGCILSRRKTKCLNTSRSGRRRWRILLAVELRLFGPTMVVSSPPTDFKLTSRPVAFGMN